MRSSESNDDRMYTKSGFEFLTNISLALYSWNMHALSCVFCIKIRKFIYFALSTPRTYFTAPVRKRVFMRPYKPTLRNVTFQRSHALRTNLIPTFQLTQWDVRLNQRTWDFSDIQTDYKVEQPNMYIMFCILNDDLIHIAWNDYQEWH